MAEYYPLLAKAVANLKDSTADSRLSIYERARKALLNQLRNVDPPIAPEHIAREEAALDSAIARLEGEIALQSLDLVEPAPVEPPVEAPPPPPVPSAPVAAPVAPPPIKPLPPPPAARPPSNRPLAPRIGATAPAQPVAPPSPPAKSWAVEPPTEPPASPVETGASEAAMSSLERLRDFGRARVEDGEAPPPDVRAEAVRRMAPTPARTARFDKRKGVFLALVLAVIAGIALLAYKLREKPEDFARPRASVSEQPEASSSKIGGRIGDAPSPAKPASAAAPSSPAPSTPAPAPIPVAQRAALLVEAPDEASKVKTYVGTAVWSVETAPNGLPGVRALVDIPEAKYKVNLFITRVNDPSLASTNRIEVRFTVAGDGPLPGVKQIAAPEMRGEDRPQGESLTGLPARITDNYFWVALAQGDVIAQRNADLMRDRAWFDIPILLTTDKIAKITIEKGAGGDQLLRQAMTAWGQ